MKLTFLGAGDAFAFEQGHNSALLEFGETNLCIDFPATNRKALKALDKDLGHVENVFVSHMHEDHVNGVQQFAYFHSIVTKKKPGLYIPRTILGEFWDAMKAGLSRHKGIKEISDYFTVFPIDDEFSLGGQRFRIVKTDHVPGMDSYGLLAEGKFYFSCDSNVDAPFLASIADSVKAIFHDCHLWNLQIDSHASLQDIQGLPPEIREKTFLMHYHDAFCDRENRVPYEKEKNVRLARPLFSFGF